jgi:hypothetical protein
LIRSIRRGRCGGYVSVGIVRRPGKALIESSLSLKFPLSEVLHHEVLPMKNSPTITTIACLMTVSAAGPAVAGFLDPLTTPIGSPTSLSSANAGGADWTDSISGGAFDTRFSYVQGAGPNKQLAAVSVASGVLNFGVSPIGGSTQIQSTGFEMDWHNADMSVVDLGAVSSLSFAYAASGGPFVLEIDVFSTTGPGLTTQAYIFDHQLNGTGTASFGASSVYQVNFIVWRTGAGSASLSMSNIEFNVVPAPGALAALGLAGIGARRRRI